MHMKSTQYLLFLALLVPEAHVWAQSSPSASPAVAERTLVPPFELRNLGELKEVLIHYHDCTGGYGCYTDDLRAQTDRAQDALANRLRTRKAGEKLGIVFDIDETILSNWPELSTLGLGFYQPKEDQWERSEKAEAIPGTVALYKQALEAGLDVFFITGRREGMRQVTEDNLKAQGITKWTKLVLRSDEEAHETALVYKSGERRKIVTEGCTLIMSIGDQWSDLRGEPEAEISVKLPNPFYFIP
jgi:acid phosphatase